MKRAAATRATRGAIKETVSVAVPVMWGGNRNTPQTGHSVRKAPNQADLGFARSPNSSNILTFRGLVSSRSRFQWRVSSVFRLSPWYLHEREHDGRIDVTAVSHVQVSTPGHLDDKIVEHCRLIGDVSHKHHIARRLAIGDTPVSNIAQILEVNREPWPHHFSQHRLSPDHVTRESQLTRPPFIVAQQEPP